MPTLSFDVTVGEQTRILAALGQHLNLGRPATGAEAKQFIIKHIVGVVRQQEQRTAEAAVVVPSPITPT